MTQYSDQATTPSLHVQNLTRAQTLISSGRVADTFWASLRGLIGHPPLVQGEGLLIVPSNSIHTHFMGFPIDVLYVDRALQVVAMDQDMAPWRFGRIHRRAHFVLELPAGTIAATGSQLGDQLELTGYHLP